ncbi:hypothetical protein JYT75_00825 [Oceanicaulis sp. AH-315-P02]|nr:hypothetical protein [Oceanicaulis sp. AH-315-P02]
MTFTELPPPLHVALFFATFYFLAALLTGVWKWRSMLSSKEGQAHKYIDIAHHAALHYGPFIFLAGVLASFWPFGGIFPAWILIEIMGWTMVLSLSRYIMLGLKGGITNQLKSPTNSARFGLVFFFFGSVLPGVAIVIGALIGLWENLPGVPF